MTDAQRQDTSSGRTAPVALTVTEIARPAEAAAPLTPALLAHGLFGQGRNLGTLARALAPSRRAATADMRNHGASPWSDAMTYAAMGADLLAAAEVAFGAAPVVLIGHSMGGKAAMAAALTTPARVAGLIVADIAPVAYDPDAAGHRETLSALLGADLSGAPSRDAVAAQLEAGVPDAGVRAFLLQNLAYETGPSGERSARWRLNAAALAASLGDLTGWPEALGADGYAGPTLFVRGGASDYVTPAGETAARRFFPDLELAVVDGAGHWLHAEKPSEFNAVVTDWLARRGL